MKSMALAGLLALTAPAVAAPNMMHQFADLALAPDGGKTATVESDDPGNLAEEPHGAVVVRDTGGQVVAHYDPCSACRYSDPAWSPKSDMLVFLAKDDKAGKTTLYGVPSGSPKVLTVIDGVANTPRYSPDGTRIALLATLGAHKMTGAIEAGAALVGEIGASPDEQRIAVMPAAGGALKPVSPADTYVYEYSWTPDGKGFAATSAKGNGDNNWWIATLDYIDAGTGALRIIAAPKMQMDAPIVSPDGKTVAFIGGVDERLGLDRRRHLSRAAGRWRRQGRHEQLQRHVHGPRLAWRQPRRLRPGRRPCHGGEHRSRVRQGRHALVRAGFGAKPDIRQSGGFCRGCVTAASVIQDFTHAAEIARGRLPQLAAVTNANAGLPATVVAESVHWKNEGFDVQGWLLHPLKVGPGKHPMITIVHGGPSAASEPRYIAAGGPAWHRLRFRRAIHRARLLCVLSQSPRLLWPGRDLHPRQYP